MKKYSLIFLLFSFLLACSGPKSPPIPPNIIVILADDAGYVDFGFMGSEDLDTPHLDKLAKAGVIFSDAHTSASVCAPSRAGLISGKYQQSFGFECNDVPANLGLSLDEKTLASALKAQDYQTVAIGKWHLGLSEPYHPNERGFDEFYGFLSGGRSYFPNEKNDRDGVPQALLHNKTRVDFEGYLSDVFGDQAVNYVEKFKEKPFFMYLAFNAVHTPMEAKAEDLKKYQDHPRQKLAAMTWSLDQNVGKLIQKLEEEGLMENTLIFFLSDNGGAANNQSKGGVLKGWKGNKFEGGHRVPFTVTWQGTIPANQKFEGLSSSLDIFATAASLAGASTKDLDGVNLMPYLRQEKSGDPHPQLFWRKDKMAASRIGDHKMIRLEGFAYRFYDLAEDIGESKDQRESLLPAFEASKEKLEQWEKEIMKPLWTENPVWDTVTYEIHQALMENRDPNYTNPAELRTFQKKSKP